MMTHDEIIAVIAHYINGGRVECSRKGGMATGETRNWRECVVPAWDFSSYDYRAKPEPLVLWATIQKSGVIYSVSFKADDLQNHVLNNPTLTLKKFAEVTE